MRLLNGARPLVAKALAIVPPSVLTSIARVALVLPYYHMVSDEEVPHVSHLYGYKSVRRFQADLDFLLTHFRAITLADLLGHVREGRPLPPRAFMLTFDDGFREMSEIVAPILRAKGVSATFFVNTAFVGNRKMCYLNVASLVAAEIRRSGSRSVQREVHRRLRHRGGDAEDAVSAVLSIPYRDRATVDDIATAIGLDVAGYLADRQPYLSDEQVRGLIACGFGIGAHSVDHPLYADLPVHDQITQTVDSLRCLRESFGLTYGAFAFPHSDRGVSRRFYDIVWETGLLDMSFGTGGMAQSEVPRHFQRFSLETPGDPAGQRVAYELTRQAAKTALGLTPAWRPAPNGASAAVRGRR